MTVATSFPLRARRLRRSATVLAVDRFAEPLPGAHWLVMVLYWFGQWGIAGSAVVAASRAELR
jgi:hypothetical protein